MDLDGLLTRYRHVQRTDEPEEPMAPGEERTIQFIVRRFAEEYLESAEYVTRADFKVLRALATCRTSAMGGQVMRCDRCPFTKLVWKGCKTRHCPMCAQEKSRQWVKKRQADLLPVPYLHDVFMLPVMLIGLALANPKVVYQALFAAAWASIGAQANDPALLGATVSALAALHTWTGAMAFLPHVHFLLTAGGLSFDKTTWVQPKPGFLDPETLCSIYVKELAQRLRAAYAEGTLRMSKGLAHLEDANAFEALMTEVEGSSGWVYSKPPFESPERTIAYLAPGRGVPIPNTRILEVNEREVTFSCGGSGDEEGPKVITLPGAEFIRRFMRHVLPQGLPRVRYYGLSANRCRGELMTKSRALLGGSGSVSGDEHKREEPKEEQRQRCPACGEGQLVKGEEQPRLFFRFQVLRRRRPKDQAEIEIPKCPDAHLRWLKSEAGGWRA